MFLNVLSCCYCWMFHIFNPFMYKNTSQKAVTWNLVTKKQNMAKVKNFLNIILCISYTDSRTCTAYVKDVQEDELQDAVWLYFVCVCVNQMGKRHFSGLEVTLMVLFSLVLVVAVALVVVLATGEPGVMREGRWWDASIISLNDDMQRHEHTCINYGFKKSIYFKHIVEWDYSSWGVVY